MKAYYSDAFPDKLDVDQNLWLYNGMDCCVTREVFNNVYKPEHENLWPYRMSRAMQGPAFTLMRRGVHIDQELRTRVHEELTSKLQKLSALFSRVCLEAFDDEINWKSPDQLKRLFYEYLNLPEVKVYDRATKQTKVSTDREAMEALSDYFQGRFFAKLVLELRGMKKLLEVVEAGADADGRMRCSYGVAATLSGRWASRQSAFGSGTNLQNITDEMRKMFSATPGWKLAQADLKTAESLATAVISGDRAYYDACTSGDVHTFVARALWPQLPWGNDHRNWRKVADTKFYRHFSHRDMAKRGGHLSNYGGTPNIAVKHLHIPFDVAKEFQQTYFGAFKGIRQYHNSVGQQLAATRCITTPLGRRCHFTGRPWDNATLKAAIAYAPQSTVADLLNYALYKLWQLYDNNQIRLLLQVHDAVVFEYREADEEWLIPQIAKDMVIPVEVNGFTLAISVDIAVGWNWGKRMKRKDGTIVNPYGLADYNGKDERVYERQEMQELDRVVCLVNAPHRKCGPISSMVGFGVSFGDT